MLQINELRNVAWLEVYIILQQNFERKILLILRLI